MLKQHLGVHQMNHIFNKPFSQIAYPDILALKETNTREEQCLEYKVQLEKDDIAADACAMANAEGGYILIGIAEGENEDEGYPKQIIGLNHSDCDEMCIREKLKDLISPPLRFNTKIIRTDGNKDLILVSIPNSIVKPHFVSKSRKGGPFPVRVNRTTSYWTMGDIQNQILARFNVYERIEKKINDLVQNSPLKNSGNPIFCLISFPEFFGKEIMKLDDEVLKGIILDNKYFAFKDYFPDGFFYLSYFTHGFQATNNPTSFTNQKCLRLHRDGSFELHHLIPLTTHTADQSQTGINPYVLESDIQKFFYKTKQIYTHLTIHDPVTLHFELQNLSPDYCFEYKQLLSITSRVIRFSVTYDSIFQEGVEDDFLSRFYNSLGIKQLRHYP